MSKPTIAMLQGDAIGGGLFIALACDLRLAAPHARFGVPVARTLGNFLAPVSLCLLVAALGPGRARELVLTARLLDADPAVRVLVLRGAGDRAFASGTDIRQFLEFETREDALAY